MAIFITPAIIVAVAIGDRNSGFGLYISIIIGLMLASMVGVIVWGINSTRKRAKKLDAIFTPWGLTGESYYYSGRQYHGEVKRRPVDVYFHRGPTLDISIESRLDARAFIVFKSEIGKYSASLANFEDVALNNPTFHNFSIGLLAFAPKSSLPAPPPSGSVVAKLSTSTPDRVKSAVETTSPGLSA